MTKIVELACVVGLVCLSTARAANEESIRVKEFVQRLGDAEEAFEGADWSFEFTELTPSSHSESAERKRDPISGSIRWNRADQRYHLIYAGTTKWIGDKADYLSRRVGMSFDGRNYYYWSHGWYGKQLPPVIADPDAGIKGIDPKDLPTGKGKNPPFGRIARVEMPGDSFQVYHGTVGLHFLPGAMPSIFDQNELHSSFEAACKEADGRLSAFLAKLPPDAVSIQPVEGAEDQFRITIAPAGMTPEMTYLSYELIVDLTNFGLVRSSKKELRTPKEREYVDAYEITTAPASGPGIKSMRIESQRIIDGDVMRKSEWRFTEFVFNPDRESSDFQLRFPTPTYIDDRILNQQYRADEPFIDRLMEAPG